MDNVSRLYGNQSVGDYQRQLAQDLVTPGGRPGGIPNSAPVGPGGFGMMPGSANFVPRTPAPFAGGSYNGVPSMGTSLGMGASKMGAAPSGFPDKMARPVNQVNKGFGSF